MREIEFDDEEIDAATSWHGGGSSMLYAVSSTGALRRGTIRPHDEEGHPLTNEEWMRRLAEKLEGEAEDAAKDAKAQARKAKGREREELLREYDALLSIAYKAQSAQR
jgi:hypothetical protein